MLSFNRHNYCRGARLLNKLNSPTMNIKYNFEPRELIEVTIYNEHKYVGGSKHDIDVF